MLVSDIYFALNVTGSSVASVSGSVQLLVNNPVRKAFYLFNDSPQALYVNVAYKATGADSNNYSFQVAPNALWSSAFPCPSGSVWGHWGVATGSVKVTEVS